MKQYTKFAKKVTFFCFIFLLFGWIFYYLYQFQYLPNHSTFDMLYSLDQCILIVTPIIILILFFFLLCIKKPRFKRLHKNLILFLVLLFVLNLCVSIVSSRSYITTGNYKILDLTDFKGNHIVTIQKKKQELCLDCRANYYKKLKIGKTYQISYRGNKLLKDLPPTIIKIDKES